MALGNQVPDKTLQKSVNQKLLQRAAGAKIAAAVSSGTVTLTGQLVQEYQRRALISALNGVSGVRRVIDTMTIAPPRNRE
jgi:osmotically-inducible protein OsmY